MAYEWKPTGITVDRKAREMAVQWNDAHTSLYPFSLLPFACPCAECRGGHEHMRSDPDPEVFDRPVENSPATRVDNVEAVGSYAITIAWEDGHHYGIYNWNYLRKLCPCQECRVGKEVSGGTDYGE